MGKLLYRLTRNPIAVEFVFSLNAACAVSNALLLYVFKNLASEKPSNDAGYYFLRAIVRINSQLRVPVINAIDVTRVARNWPWEKAQIGEELTVIVTVLGIATLIFILTETFLNTRLNSGWMRAFFGLNVFFAAPLAYLVVSFLTWDSQLITFWKDPLTKLFGGEALCAIVLIGLYRVRHLSNAILDVLFPIHAVFWVAILWPTFEIPLFAGGGRLSAWVILAVFPLSGIFWLLSIGAPPLDEQFPRRSQKWLRLCSVIAFFPSVLLWVPLQNHAINKTEYLASSTIKMTRGSCFGNCPSYEVTIHGDGAVEYTGFGSVKVHGAQKETLNEEEVQEIWSALDRVRFLELEDRAFRWCFDTGSVSVSFISKNRSKVVSSDDWCVGVKSGVQARFVEAARQIDKIVGTDQWVRCEGLCL